MNNMFANQVVALLFVLLKLNMNFAVYLIIYNKRCQNKITANY